MRFSRHERLIIWSVTSKHAGFRRTSCLAATTKSCIQRAFSASQLRNRQDDSGGQQDVAILGGGITGLASAYYLSKADPSARITVYEKSERFGGWIDTNIVGDGAGGSKAMVLERGPRTLRPVGNGAVTLKLIEELDLQDECIFVGKGEPAAVNRYVYDGMALRRLPNPRLGWLATGMDLWAGRDTVGLPLASGLLHEWHYEAREPDGDESLGAFLTRRFNSETADLASAMMHGIYAGDIDQLSVRALFPRLPYMARYRWGVGKTMLMAARTKGFKIVEKHMLPTMTDQELTLGDTGFAGQALSSSVIAFKDGMSTLCRRLVRKLEENSNVHLIRNATVVPKLGDSRDQLTIEMDRNGETSSTTCSTVLSTIGFHPSWVTNEADRSTIGHTTAPTVTVMVVNLYYSSKVLINGTGAFGYLIPRSVPFSQNPESALGVVFDSFAAPGQDATTGSKLTVMLGGHYWNGMKRLPSEEDGIEMARSVLQRHLGVTEPPLAAQATLQRDCITQYTVGHQARTRKLHQAVKHRYGGRLKLAGSAYGGVGVNDCVRAAWDLGRKVKADGWQGWTGLERFEGPEIDVVELFDQPDGTTLVAAAPGSPNAPAGGEREMIMPGRYGMWTSINEKDRNKK